MSPRFGFLFLNFGAKKAFPWPGLDGQAIAHDAFWIFSWCLSILVNRGSLDCVLHRGNSSLFFWFRPGLDL